jgi:hypothetical protein
MSENIPPHRRAGTEDAGVDDLRHNPIDTCRVRVRQRVDRDVGDTVGLTRIPTLARFVGTGDNALTWPHVTTEVGASGPLCDAEVVESVDADVG